MKNHYDPCWELDECNRLIEEYWNTQHFKARKGTKRKAYTGPCSQRSMKTMTPR